MKLIRDGNFVPLIRFFIWFLGLASAVLFYFFATGPLMFWGIVGSVAVAAIGSYAEQAHTLRIKPFDNSYKKAKKSYEKNVDH